MSLKDTLTGGAGSGSRPHRPIILYVVLAIVALVVVHIILSVLWHLLFPLIVIALIGVVAYELVKHSRRKNQSSSL